MAGDVIGLAGFEEADIGETIAASEDAAPLPFSEIDPPTAAKLANEFGIKIYTIAAGTNNSISRIPGRGMIRNEIDTNTLKDISKETGGQFFRATDKEALSQIYARIDELERSEIEVRNFTDYKELFRWFLVPALSLALIYFVLKRYIFKVII